eukprot:CAMPEP_0204610166 /NCGR_PEP_ID=MMETSP0661-20131031/61351_1 /ASSEMBLY_ACC=CAM_ASM_000606 /TAXON_ID=109239 /ORGANISM="Alexandrium margalefi, Strain AMGDE01CS-322" /LENGTH=83 /DNA_ID=CAMNT_0051621967 /DNA_START=531 /DNA_END=782 /DNA_ORIENTATION=-
MAGLARAALAVLLFGIVMALQGCGCDKDKSTKCMAAATTGTMCKRQSTCSKDAGCCSHKEGGTDIKTAMAAACTATPSENACA